MEFDYLRGNKSLFDRAPIEAMAVFENHINGDIFFAESTKPGTRYWLADGTPGARIGLIGSRYNALALVAERRRHIGPINQPALIPVYTKKPDPVAKKIAAAVIAAKPAPVPDDGFTSVDQIEISDVNTPAELAVLISPKSYFAVRKAVAEEGERVEIQLSTEKGQLRLRKVTDGGILIKKNRSAGCANLSNALSFPESKSVSIPLTLAEDGWLYGEIPFNNRARFDKVRKLER